MNILRHAISSLLKSPRFTIAAVLTLGVAIAADCVVFSVADAVLFRPLPYKEPDRLVHVITVQDSQPWAPGLSAVREWRRRNNVFEDIAFTSPQDVSLKMADYPEPITIMSATANVFDVLGVKATLGRTFSAAEAYSGEADQVAIIGYDFWQTRFHADPNVLGKQLDLGSGITRTIIGVLPSDCKYSYPSGVPIWIPMPWDGKGPRPGSTDATRPSQVLSSNLAIARLKPGISTAQAEAGMLPVLAELEYEGARWRTEARIFGVQGWTARQVRSLLITLLGAVTFLLLIGCANVANLTLARMADRHRETAIRASLGAGRWRIVREFLAESLVLALAAGSLGLLLSSWGMEAVRSVLPPELPRGDELSLDWRVALFALSLSVISAAVFGLLPALKWSRTSPSEGLASSTGGIGGRYRNRVRASLVAAETALALVLTGGAGLMMNSFIRLTRVDLGFNPNNVLAVRCDVPKQNDFTVLNEAKLELAEKNRRTKNLALSIEQTNERMLDALRAIPGVQQVGRAFEPPMFKGGWGGTFLPPKPGDPKIQARMTFVSGDYFKAMQIPLLAGRPPRIDSHDGQEREIVLSQSLQSC